MANTLHLPKTLQEAVAFFSDPQRTFDYAVKLRWPDGKVTCPRCDGTEHSFISTRRQWFCKGCKKQFTVKVGTIFEDSALGMDKWMIAVWLIVNAKNGISSYEVSRALGITQKSAWFMMHRVRLALHEKHFVQLGGSGKEVEVDETFIGGLARNMHANKRKLRITHTGTKDKTAVMGILERGGEVRAAVVGNRKKHLLHKNIRAHVKAGSAIYTDALMSYQGLKQQGFEHQVVDHAESYVDGQIHTNGLENFWSLFKRQVVGQHHHISVKHLHRYLDEVAFKFNNREAENIFSLIVLNLVIGEALRYKTLTAPVSPLPSESEPSASE